MKEYDQISLFSDSSPEHLNYTQQGFHYQNFIADSQALMQTRHDPKVVFLQRLLCSREFRVYHIVSAVLSALLILSPFISDTSALETLLLFLLYLATACELAARHKVLSNGDHYKRMENAGKIGIVGGGFVAFLYQCFANTVILRIAGPLVILAKSVWEYLDLVREDKEQMQTRARASEELSFDVLNSPVQIEMGHIGKPLEFS
eukprot:TRINITY_DN1905_c0_g1_i16.p1 TRINITY_DN1905_c0_g1~~TRINITY_DN1905_c0_g1_i16.p1  ORF type:complete len:204 (-),score=40.95 TRINITY_DN1905_c0_g1_i16:152-763(-)